MRLPPASIAYTFERSHASLPCCRLPPVCGVHEDMKNLTSAACACSWWPEYVSIFLPLGWQWQCNIYRNQSCALPWEIGPCNQMCTSLLCAACNAVFFQLIGTAKSVLFSEVLPCKSTGNSVWPSLLVASVFTQSWVVFLWCFHRAATGSANTSSLLLISAPWFLKTPFLCAPDCL